MSRSYQTSTTQMKTYENLSQFRRVVEIQTSTKLGKI